MDLLHISQELKKARLRQKLTIEQLAGKTGLSKGFLSRLENFRITPSLKALNKVASSLGIGMADLFQPRAESPKVVFGSLREGEEIVRNESTRFGLRYFSLAYRKLDRKLNPFLVEYHPARRHRGLLTHTTDEFFALLHGKVDFYVFDENNPRRLRKGDTVYLSKDIPHAVRLAKGQRLAQALVVYREEGDE